MNNKPATNLPIEDEEAVVLRYVPFADGVVQRAVREVPPHVDRADLLSAGRVGLVKAFRGFNPRLGVSFENFARHRIRGAAFDELRKLDTLPRKLREKTRRVLDTENRLANEIGRQPTESEMASGMGLDLSAYRALRREIQTVSFLYLDESPFWMNGEEGEGVSGYDMFPDETCSLGDELERRDTVNVVYRLIKELPSVQQRVLALYYVEGLNLREVGEALGFSEANACLIHKKAIKKLRTRFQAEEVRCTLVG